MNKKTLYTLKLLSGILLLALGIIYTLFLETNLIITLLFVVGGMTLIIVSSFRYNRFGAGIHKDERTIKLSLVSSSYAWFISFLALNILFWIDYLHIVDFTTNAVIAIMMFIMIVSMGLLQIFFKNKPDYENKN